MTRPHCASLPYSDWQRWRACERKRPLPSEAVARNYATLLGWRYGGRYEVYRCRWCEGWHVATVREAA